MNSPLLLLADMVYAGFALLTPLLFLLKLCWRAKTAFWNELLLSSNILLLLTFSLYTLYILVCIIPVFSEGIDTQTCRWRILGPYWYSYWTMILGRTLLPQILWIRKSRKNYGIALLLAFFAVSGIILERLIIFLTTLYRDYLPSSRTYYSPGSFEIVAILVPYIVVVLLVYMISNRIRNRAKLRSESGEQ
jgi:molybdopterin-containing oxidoreductase family membrane subunit